jgi:hypothetical protein
MSLAHDIAARIGSECGDLFRIVGLAGDMAALKNGTPPATPAAYVYVIEEAAGENTRLNGVLQRVEIDIGVMLIAQNLSDHRGGAAAGDIETLRQAVKRALIGWCPASMAADGSIIELVGGSIQKANAGTVWFEQVFGLATYEGDAA